MAENSPVQPTTASATYKLYTFSTDEGDALLLEHRIVVQVEGVPSQSSKFYLVVSGEECYNISIFEQLLRDHGCTVTGEKVKVEGIIVTLYEANRSKVGESLGAIEGDILMLADFQGTTKTKFLEKILGLKYHAPPTADNDETDSDQARTNELEGSLTFGEGRGDKCSIMLTGLAKRILLQKVTRGKKFQVYQVPGNGSNKYVHWSTYDSNTILTKCMEHYSDFVAKVYLISSGNSLAEEPSPEVLSGIIIANAFKKQKCAIVLTSSRGLCREKLAPLEEKHLAAQEKCKYLIPQIQELASNIPHAEENLKSAIVFAIEVEKNIKALENAETNAHKELEEYMQKRKEHMKLEQEQKQNEHILVCLQSWQDVVKIYHTDDLFNPPNTTTITADESIVQEDPQKYLDMSTLVEWSPEGYERKLQQQIEQGTVSQRKVQTYGKRTSGGKIEDITEALFNMNEIHIVKTYSVDNPWDEKEEVWVVKETLNTLHVLYIALENSPSGERYYTVYENVRRSRSCMWTRTYKTLPDSSENWKFQLIDI